MRSQRSKPHSHYEVIRASAADWSDVFEGLILKKVLGTPSDTAFGDGFKGYAGDSCRIEASVLAVFFYHYGCNRFGVKQMDQLVG